jgi:serine/threonine protein phosphatase PrpC
MAFQILNHKVLKSPQIRDASKENPQSKGTVKYSVYGTRVREPEEKITTEVSVNPTPLDSNPASFRVLESGNNRKFIVHKTLKKPPQTKLFLRSEPNSLIPKPAAIELPKHQRLFSIVKTPAAPKVAKDPLIRVDYENIWPLAAIGFRTAAGTIGGKSKLNQDVLFLNNSLLRGVTLLGLFDGHGMNGHRVAGFLALNFEGRLGSADAVHALAKKGQVFGEAPNDSFFDSLFNCLNQMLCSNPVIDTTQSGSTGIVIAVTAKQVVCASVGDSSAFLLRLNDSSLETHQVLKALEISQQHTPYDEIEASRITSLGGEVRPATNQYGEDSGPLRVFKAKYRYPGLMMTRSFGDKLGHSCGVICSPSMLKLTSGEDPNDHAPRQSHRPRI